jgi:hypothetical protein
MSWACCIGRRTVAREQLEDSDIDLPVANQGGVKPKADSDVKLCKLFRSNELNEDVFKCVLADPVLTESMKDFYGRINSPELPCFIVDYNKWTISKTQEVAMEIFQIYLSGGRYELAVCRGNIKRVQGYLQDFDNNIQNIDIEFMTLFNQVAKDVRANFKMT